MTVRELIAELLECDMDSEVSVLMDFKDETESFSDFAVKHDNWGYGKKFTELEISLLNINREDF